MIYRVSGFHEIDKFYSLLSEFCAETEADDDALAIILDNIESGKTRVFVAIDNGEYCGVLGYQKAGETAVSDFFFVVPERRKEMIGGRLFREASRDAIERGLCKIVLIVTEDKEPLYTKIGFKRKFILLEKEI